MKKVKSKPIEEDISPQEYYRLIILTLAIGMIVLSLTIVWTGIFTN